LLNKKSHIIFILFIAALSWLVSFPLNGWLSATMMRHQLLQLPAMFFLGMLSGVRFSKYFHFDISTGIAILIFIMSSFIFWMLPHSIDMAVINAAFNRVMHVNMLVAGLFLIPVLQQTLLEIKIIFLGMMSSMLLATGITLVTYDLLLCSAFNIEQQKETGYRIIIAGVVLLATTIFIFLSSIGKKKKSG
jgi:hypothetical protein